MDDKLSNDMTQINLSKCTCTNDTVVEVTISPTSTVSSTVFPESTAEIVTPTSIIITEMETSIAPEMTSIIATSPSVIATTAMLTTATVTPTVMVENTSIPTLPEQIGMMYKQPLQLATSMHIIWRDYSAYISYELVSIHYLSYFT